MKGKCSNCGKPIEQESNKNWKAYCKECIPIAVGKIEEIIKNSEKLR